MKPLVRTLLLMLLLPAAAKAGFQEFTVEYKTAPGPKARATDKVPEKMVIRMDGKRMRQDFFTREGRTTFILEIQGDKQISTILDPESKTYMRHESPAERDTLDLFDMPRGDQDPCANDPKLSCERLGTDRLLGYKVIKWKIVDREDGSTSVMWYAPSLGFYLKLEDDEMVQTATRVEDRAPPAHDFEIPKDYRKMDLNGMIMGGMQDAMESPPDDVADERTAEMEAAYGDDHAEDRATAGMMDEITGEAMEGLKNAIGNLFGH